VPAPDTLIASLICIAVESPELMLLMIMLSPLMSPVTVSPSLICMAVLSDELISPLITGAVNVLLVSVSVVALPTNVSVAVGSVNVPVLDIALMIGDVNVLLVNVSDPANVAKSPSLNAVLNCAVVPDNVFDVKEIDLFVNVSVVARPTNVSVEVGKVNVPVLTIDEITGVVSVGDVAKTSEPEPVSSDITPANSDEVVAEKSLNLFDV